MPENLDDDDSDVELGLRIGMFISTSEAGSAAVASAKRTPAKRSLSTTASSTKLAKKGRHSSGGGDWEDEMTFYQSLFASKDKNKQQSIKIKSDALQEQLRHNRKMEGMKQKLMEWKTKKNELHYKQELLRTRVEFQKMGFTLREIVSMVQILNL